MNKLVMVVDDSEMIRNVQFFKLKMVEMLLML